MIFKICLNKVSMASIEASMSSANFNQNTKDLQEKKDQFFCSNSCEKFFYLFLKQDGSVIDI